MARRSPRGAGRAGGEGPRREETSRDAELLELRIESLAAGGDGVGRASDGRVVFVPFTAPGDRVRVRVTGRRARWLRGVVEELCEPGPGRTDPLCPVFGRCGGCAWQHLDAATQREAKRGILADAITRIAKLPVPEPLEVRAGPPYGYRTRARAVAQRGVVGFRRRGSHAVCATRRCPVLAPALDAELLALADAPPRAHGEWELSAGDDGATCRAAFPVRDSGAFVRIRSGEFWLRVSAGSFLQGNGPLRGELTRAVTAAAGGGEALLELHAGAGLFTLPLSRRFRRVLAVEANPHAVADLEENLATHGIGHVEIAAEPAERVFSDFRFPAFSPDVVVVDPPRTGLDGEVLSRLAELGAARVVYVSCDPATLARDVGGFADRGWELSALTGFDLFPQTPHLEALAVLRPG